MKNSIENLTSIKGKKIIVRVDFNVPFKDDGSIRDNNRIVAALPTIKDLISKGAKVILMSHLGKIDFKKTPEEIEKAKKKNNMAPVAKALSELLGQEVIFVSVTKGKELEDAVNSLKDGQVLLMQNTRYEKGETKNDAELASYWASFGDGFVMDAFGSAHRAHCSTVGIPEILEKAGKPVAMGYLVAKEVKALSRCVSVEENQRPYVAILGGSKVSDKIQVIESLLKKCDKILIGGGMAYTFLVASGVKSIGNSLFEADQVDYAKKCLATGKIVLPVDNVVADSFADAKDIKTVGKEIPESYLGLDVGPETEKLFTKEILAAKTIFWNGPMGVFENEKFAAGTKAVCKACADATKLGAFSVIGGGDSAAAVKQFGYKNDFSHVSTGGGASLEMIQFDGHIPGIDVIPDVK